MQAKLMAVMAVLHNFIRINDPDGTNSLESLDEQRGACQEGGVGDDEDDNQGVITPAEQRRARERRDGIAKQMWEDYMLYLTQNSQ